MNAFTKTLTCVALAAASLGVSQQAAEAHSIASRSNWNYIGPTRSGQNIYASIRQVGFNGAPVITYDRLAIKRHGRRRYQLVHALCNRRGLYRINNGFFKTARFGSFRHYEIQRVCANGRFWRRQPFRQTVMRFTARAFSSGGHAH